MTPSTRRAFTLATLTVTFLVAASPGRAATTGKNIASFALSTEPPQLDSTKATDTQSGFVLGHVMEGLTRYGKDSGNIPGVAEKWKITDKGATFWLRKDAKWSDGKPVTAKDFVYAWRVAVDPKTASEYAFILYPVKNAEAINKGSKNGDELGVKAVGDHQLEVTFEKPCGYFLALTAFATYMPIREDFHRARGDKYAADATDLLYNGPFVLTRWVHGSELHMEKNRHYWNQAAIHLDAVAVPYITPDNSARFNFFKDHKTDMLEGLNKDDLVKAQREGFKMKNFPDGSLAYMEFNFREGRATRNKNLRKAIQAVFNPTEYINTVIGIPGTKAANGLIPSWMKGANGLFHKEFPRPAPKQDLAAAKRYIEAARKELGGKLPALVWLTGDTPTNARAAEYFQSVFKKHLGIDLKIDKQIFKQRLAKMTAGDFDIVAAGWSPDFADPMTYAELKTSWNENNRGRWENATYDRFIREAQSTADQKKRMKAMAEAEKVEMEEIAVLPTSESSVVWVQHDRVADIYRHNIGPDPDFTFARVVK